MDWIFWLCVVGGVAGVLALKKLGQISPATAREHLRNGAKVIDVRSPGEFAEEHLPVAVNIPLGSLRDEIARIAPDKNTVILLHCLSGGRSALGRRMLLQLGYKQVFNLGSLSRAKRIVNA